MTNQPTLPAVDTPGKPTTRLTGGYMPHFTPPEPYSLSTGHRIVHGHVKARPGKLWKLYLDPLPGETGSQIVEFPDDDAAISVFIEKHGLTFPEPSYRCDVKFKVKWRKIRHTNKPGSTNVVSEIELLPEEPMTDQTAKPTTLTEAFPRTADNQPADNTTHWIDAKGNQKTYWPRVKSWAAWAGVPDKEQEQWVHNNLGVAKTREYLGSMDAAICAVIKAALRKQTFDKLNRAMTLQDFIDATEYSNLEAALEKGESDGYIMSHYADYLASDKHKGNEPQTQQPASTGLETAKAEPQGKVPTPPTTNATAGKSDGKKDTSVNDKQPDTKDEIRNKYNSPQRGKDYLMVQGRVILFRLDHPDWTLETDLIGMTDDAAVFKATIRNADGRIIATGHGRASEGSTKHLGGRWIEKAETAAIGRALALAGFGTDDTLDDADFLADSPVAKAA